MRVSVPIPQSLADEHTLIAQKYAGYFIGHPFRAAQQRTGPGAIVVDRARPWREPSVVADDCDFCQRLTDEEAVRRIAGYQHAIDIEVLRACAASYTEWLAAGGDDVPEVEDVQVGERVAKRGVLNNPVNRRRFIEQHPERFDTSALPVVELPLRLKRKLCIDWNHLYNAWLQENPGVSYDFEAREFYREGAEEEQAEHGEVKAWWGSHVVLGG